MAVDWKYILSISPEELNDEEKDELYNTVTWFDSDKEEPDLVQTKTLLRISQEILKYKGEQVETLLHELDEIAIKQGEEEARKFDSDIELRSARSRKSSTVEIENLEQKYNEMKNKYKKQQRMNQKNLEEIEVLKKNMKSLELEKRQLEQDLANKTDGSESSEMSDTVKDQHRELVETVHNKNKQLSDLLHDIEEVEKENILLREKLAHVRDELAVATSEIQSQTDKLSAFDIQLKDANESIKKLTIDNELLQEDIQELSVQKTKQEERMAEFTEKINKRIEDWQKVLEEKDNEIRALKSKTAEIGRSSSSSSTPKQDQPHLAALQKLLSERDSQLMEVQSKLEDAVHEMEASTHVIEELKREKEEKNKTIAELNAVRKELKKQLKVTHERAQKLQEEVDYAENIAEDKSLELHNIISHLEGSDRLDEAQTLKELRDMRSLNRMNEKQIMSLVKNVNRLQDTCDQMMRENSFLREKMGISEEDSLTIPNYQSKHKQYKKELLRLKKKVLHFEEENINLRTEVKNLNRINYMLREDISEGERRVEQKQDSKTDVRTQGTETGLSLDEPDEVVGVDLSLSLGEIIAEQDKNSNEDRMLEEQIKALCEENEALRKGMHEILNSLNSKKESSLKEIKSETFEKLLRALDVKHISGWYHPAMRLQAEVHNVEGINQELREQLRICRLELEEVRNEKQESLILLSKRSSVLSSPRHLAQSSNLKDMRTLESLNENVDQLLERSSADAKVCQEIATKMNDFNEDFAALEKQLENLYEQSMKEKKTYEDTIAELKTKNSKLERQIQTLDEQLKIFMEDVEVEDTTKKIAELTGKNVEAELKRDYLEEECKKLQEKVEDLKKDLLEAELKCSKTLLEITRNDKTLRNKIRSMESRLDATVSLEDHQKSKKDLENLTLKYRELAEDYKKLGENHQMELDLIQRSKQMTEDEKQELKDRLNECLVKLKGNVSEEAIDGKVQNLSKQLSECEINLIGEKQKANHINNLYELVKEQLNKSEERFREYENHTKDIMHKNLALQGQLKEVEDRLCECVEVELYNASKEDYQKVLERENELLELIAKLQEERNASEMNQKSVAIWTSSKEEELLFLKHQVVDLLSVSDDKAVIARMGSDLMQSRMKEEELKKKCEVLSGQLEQCHDEWLDSLRAMDEEKEKFDMKEKYLQKKNRIIRDLLENQKFQYYGCIPLTSEQRFIQNIRLTLENNHASFLSLYKAQNVENENLALKEQAEVELRHYMDAKEILGENEEEVQKLLNWLQERKHLELELIRYRRQADFKDLQLQQCNARIEIQNDQIAKLEEDLLLFFKDPDSASITSSFIQPKIHPEPQIIDKLVKLTRSQDVQTEVVEVDGSDKEAKRLENLKTELLNTKNELLAKEEALQQLKTKLNECEMTVSLFRTQIGDKQAQINFYEKHILELQASIKVENMLQKGQSDNGGGGDGASNETVLNEEVMSLKASIKGLQDAIVLKDESILHYQSLLKEDRDNHSLAAARMQEELKTLKNTVAEEKQKRLEFEEQKEEEASRSKAAVDQYIKQVHSMEQHADELHTQVSTLESQLATSRQESVRWRSLANDRLKGIESLRQSLEEQHKEELEIYKKDSDKWRHEVLSLKDLINKHKNEILQVQPDLQNLLKSKDEKINELTSLVRNLREEVHPETENDIYNKLSEFEKAYEQLSKEHEILKKKFDSMLQKERNAREEIRDLRGQLLKTKRTPSSARSEKSDRSIKDQLQKKISTLEEEVTRLKEELASQVAVNETHKVKAAEDFDRWKKQKQSQQTIDKLKSKLKERDGEFEKIQQTCNGYRSLIERLEREKHSLENRVKALKTNVNIYGFENAQQNETATMENAKLLSEIEELKAKLEMQQRHAGGLGAAMMQEKLEAQERKLAIMELSGRGTPEIRGEFERLQSTISNLQKSNLFLEAQNIELKMDLEKSQKDFSSFKEQIQHLENYIEVLKKEKEKLPSNTSGGSQAGHSSQESRRVSELERTVLVLKRVVEKLQMENKRLLSGKRPLADRTLTSDKLRKDYNSLKEQYNESVHKISELEAVLNSTNSKLKAYEECKHNTDDFLALSAELNRVRGQLDQKSQLLDKVKTLLHAAAAKEKVLLKEISDLKNKLYQGDRNLAQPSTSYG